MSARSEVRSTEDVVRCCGLTLTSFLEPAGGSPKVEVVSRLQQLPASLDLCRPVWPGKCPGVGLKAGVGRGVHVLHAHVEPCTPC